MAELLVHSCLVNDLYFSCIIILYVIEYRQIYHGPGLTVRKLVKYKLLTHIAKSCNKELCIFWLQISERQFLLLLMNLKMVKLYVGNALSYRHRTLHLVKILHIPVSMSLKGRRNS